MKIHKLRIETSLLEIDGHEEWLFRIRADIQPNGTSKQMQKTYRCDIRNAREQFPKMFLQIGMDLSQLLIMDEGAI